MVRVPGLGVLGYLQHPHPVLRYPEGEKEPLGLELQVVQVLQPAVMSLQLAILLYCQNLAVQAKRQVLSRAV
jgi:hypothetical protein